HRPAWTKGLPVWAREQAEFRLGFVAEVRGTAWQFLRDGPRLLERTPVTHARLRAVNRCRAAFFASPLLGRLTSLDLSDNYLAPKDMAALFASTHLGRLTELWLSSGFRRGAEVAGALAAALPPRSLTALNVWETGLGAKGARVLARAPLVERLTSLSLR